MVFGLLSTAGTLEGFRSPAFGASSMPYFAFNSSTNRLYSGASSNSGSAAALSGAGTSISFDYSGLSVVNASAWQSIAQNGYFTNSAPIHGLSSFLVELSNGSSVQVYWSKTTTFSESDSETLSANSTCTFASSYPSYIKVVALVDSVILSASICFDCQLHYLESTFTLGKYPQALVEDSATLTALAKLSADSGGYMEYEGEKYKLLTNVPGSGNQSVSGNVTFMKYTNYYFKVQPIEWRVLAGAGTSTGLLMSERILDQGMFYTAQDDRDLSGSTIHPNNYKYSTLRAMLNGYDGGSYTAGNYLGKGFLDVAFTATEKTLIATTTVNNSAATTASTESNPNACDNTDDKIFALSYQELLNASYGFDPLTISSTRYGFLTDYARAMNAYIGTDPRYYGNGYWWSRSPSADDGTQAYDVGYDGYPAPASVSYGSNGIRPALRVTIS